ncbi:MAG: type II toxin-antitoxin system VapC family toxin [Acidobacteria bacterium]|nr:type II toxin-antitoxin system VapC family toxin [Acidobacteriota bacterium]
MNLYAETSAVVAWLLDEERGDRAWSQLVAADTVHTSDLTLIECDRTFRRGSLTGRLTASESVRLQAILDTASAHWTLYAMDAEIVHRSRRSFPREPVRTLDAIHLATVLAVRNLAPDVKVLSFDDRIRQNAASLGFPVAPDAVAAPRTHS